MRLCSLLLFACLVSACATQAVGASTCGSATIGAAGGVVLSPLGATLVVPPGALASDTIVELCALSPLTRERDQQSDTFVVRPTGTTLAIPATFTMPTLAARIDDERVEVSQTLDDTAPVTLFDVRTASSSVAFEHDRFGYVRVFGRVVEVMDDAGTVDSALPRDAWRPDTGPLPLAPVVVGVDLEPADYACLGAELSPQSGDPATVGVHVVDWHDRSFRAGYQIRVVRGIPNNEWDCTGLTDCVMITSDTLGNATLEMPSGPAWIDILQLDPTFPASDERHSTQRHVHWPVVLPDEGGPVELEALSFRTMNQLGLFSGGGAQVTLGRVRDCSGDVVQRARIRVFRREGREVLEGDAMNVSYGNTGLPTIDRDRSGADGTFLIENLTDESGLRIEAWGQLVEGGPEVMLSCAQRGVSTLGLMVVGDLTPARSDRDPSCSE